MLEMIRCLLLLYQNFLILNLMTSDLFPDQVFTIVPWMNTATYKYLHIHAARGGPMVVSASLYQSFNKYSVN